MLFALKSSERIALQFLCMRAKDMVRYRMIDVK